MQLSTALKKHLEKVDIKTRYVFFFVLCFLDLVRMAVREIT